MAPRPQPSGRTIRTAEGYPAFVPDPLPPDFTWTPELLRALSAADRAVGALAGEGRRLPNPHLLAPVGEGKRDRVFCAGAILAALERA